MAKIIRKVIARIHVVIEQSPFAPPREVVVDPHNQGIGRHFESVGIHLNNAAKEFSRKHPEVPQYA